MQVLMEIAYDAPDAWKKRPREIDRTVARRS
jgi:hypothetical protein